MKDSIEIKTTYHRDGTVTYWSVYNQVWARRASSVPNKELAAMSGDERERVQRHLGRRSMADTHEDIVHSMDELNEIVNTIWAEKQAAQANGGKQ